MELANREARFLEYAQTKCEKLKEHYVLIEIQGKELVVHA